ncbi:sulfotransferase [Alcanivorax nanhaiticus]|uniref:Sulfotransferase n=1 Tax=Alcanivorax nanhaiticus TaxID=1177154 RepID=A0A095SN29_9GAMM|nr:sulfotransferase [Alcanivorax nanhaiticus]KGD65744.1 sulfotransferase [Alcanivorax nanhaiticus]
MQIGLQQIRPVTEQLCNSGRYDQALSVLKQCAQRGVTDFSALNRAVDAAVQIGDLGAGAELVDLILKGWPKDSRSWELRYKILHAGAQWSEARIVLKRVKKYAQEATPEYFLANAEVLERLFQPDKALVSLEEIPKLISVDEHSRYWYLKATILLQMKDYQGVVDCLSGWLPKAPHDRFAAACWKFLGKAQDALKSYDDAFRAIKSGNDLRASLDSRMISENSLRRRVEVFRTLFTPEWVSGWEEITPTDHPPVFLIGFPRSGTTLLEQVLDAHPDVQALEEQPTMAAVLRQSGAWMNAKANMDGALKTTDNWKQQWLASFDYLSRINEKQVVELRDAYYKVVDEKMKYNRSNLLIDKMPLNTVDMGLILKIFPNAKFIVALRHPCDCVLSAYMQSFQMNDAMANFLDLGAAASFYRNVMSLLWQYEKVFDLRDRVHAIRYEDLIEDLDGEAAKVINFLGLEWNDAVTRYDEHARQRGTLATPSYQGVTQKIYSSSKERWRNYAQWMAPVLHHFEEAAERYGYDLSI